MMPLHLRIADRVHRVCTPDSPEAPERRRVGDTPQLLPFVLAQERCQAQEEVGSALPDSPVLHPGRAVVPTLFRRGRRCRTENR